ncbi:MAG: ECF transporter S component [Aerococcus sp.]|nr:ECF transporter S component [Aerococcus sp.]
MKNKHKIYVLTVLSLISAVLIIQTFVPWLGYLPLGFANVTIAHVTVIIGAVLLGVQGGAILGGIWGVLALIRNLVQPNILSPIFYNPIVAILPRLLVGVIVGFLYQQLAKRMGPLKAGAISGAIGALTNTVLVTIAVVLFAKTTYAQIMHIPESAVLIAFVAAVAFNAIFEVLVAAVLTPIITRPLIALRDRQSKS